MIWLLAVIAESVTVAYYVFSAIIAAVAIATPYIMKANQGKDGRTDADSFAAGDNPTDPRAPIRIVYGRPTWTPPVLSDYAKPAAVNRWNPDDAPGRVTVMSVSGGPIDGGDSQLWIDDVPVSIQIDADDPSADQTLTREIPYSGRYAFPLGNVVADSVSVYVDGVFVGAYSVESGGVVDDNETTHTGQIAKLKKFTELTGEWEVTTSTSYVRFGFILPHDGIVAEGSLTVNVLQNTPRESIKFRSSGLFATASREASIPVPAADIHLAQLADGSAFVWIDFADNELSETRISFEASYRVRARLVVDTDDVGRSFVTFTDDPGSSAVVTAKYKAGALAAHTTTHFRPGTPDQFTLPLDDGVRNTINVGGKLTQGTQRQYSTVNEVDELEVGIQSGPAGMFTIRKKTGAFRAATRQLRISIKKSTAPDTRSSGNQEITKGWVVLDLRHAGEIGGQTRGTATWTFALAALWTATLKHNPARTNLPFAKYDVEIVATDGERGGDDQDELHFAHATEIQRDKLTLPHHATYTVEVDDPDVVTRAPTYALAIMGRRVWVPASNAAYDATTERPEPGAHKWTRNPVWCTCDLIVDPVFGGGQFYDWTNIDVAEAIVAAAFCDATVTNADGTTEPRSELDIVVDTRDALSKNVSKMLVGAQVIGALTGGTWHFLPDVDGSSVMTLTSADYKLGEISMSYASIETTPNEVAYSFPNEFMDFELDSDTLTLPGNEPDARVTHTVEFSGVRRTTQAIRAASLALRQLHTQRRTVTLIASGWRALLLEAGDIVTLTAAELNLTAWTCRVQSVEFGSTLIVKLKLGEHNSAVYSDAFLGPVGGIEPGSRPPPASMAAAGTITTTVTASGEPKVQFTPFQLAKFHIVQVTNDPVKITGTVPHA